MQSVLASFLLTKDIKCSLRNPELKRADNPDFRGARAPLNLSISFYFDEDLVVATMYQHFAGCLGYKNKYMWLDFALEDECSSIGDRRVDRWIHALFGKCWEGGVHKE